jgi:hypothetical protein
MGNVSTHVRPGAGDATGSLRRRLARAPDSASSLFFWIFFAMSFGRMTCLHERSISPTRAQRWFELAALQRAAYGTKVQRPLPPPAAGVGNAPVLVVVGIVVLVAVVDTVRHRGGLRTRSRRWSVPMVSALAVTTRARRNSGSRARPRGRGGGGPEMARAVLRPPGRDGSSTQQRLRMAGRGAGRGVARGVLPWGSEEV